jgi:hypothetical protein
MYNKRHFKSDLIWISVRQHKLRTEELTLLVLRSKCETIERDSIEFTYDAHKKCSGLCIKLIFAFETNNVSDLWLHRTDGQSIEAF